MTGPSTPLAIVGASGHAAVVVDAARRTRQYQIIGLVDPALPPGTLVEGYPVLGSDDVLTGLAETHPGLACIVALGDNAARRRVVDEIEAHGLPFATVVHPGAIIANSVELGPGAFVAAGAIINPGACIGPHAIVNTGATVDHHTRIDDFAFVGPNAALAGNVTVGRGAMIGIGACVVPGVTIGEAAVVGAGAVVIGHVGAGERVAGNPARRLSVAGASRKLG